MVNYVLTFFRKAALKKRIRKTEEVIVMNSLTLSSHGGYDDIISNVMVQAGLSVQSQVTEPHAVYINREEIQRRIFSGPAVLESMLKKLKQLGYLKERLRSLEQGHVVKKAVPSYTTGMPFGITTTEDSRFYW